MNIFSFFSGSGFLDLGFEYIGFNIKMVNEFAPTFMSAYKYSRSKMNLAQPEFGYQTTDINNFLNERKKELNNYIERSQKETLTGFIGGPACPDFSVAGKKQRERW